MKLFGFEFKKAEQESNSAPSFVNKEEDDGALLVAAGGAYGTYVDLEGTVRTEAELVTKYREMSLHPEVDSAVDEIINESISIDEDVIVDINLDNIQIPDNVKKVIREEFNTCLRLLEFNTKAYDIYRRWYIDGRLYYHVVIDEKNPQMGIKELRYIDPRKIRKVKEIQRKKLPNNMGLNALGDVNVSKTVNEYFVFSDRGFNFGNKNVGPSTTGLKITKDSILHVVSGFTDNNQTMVLSYLHKAIKALNQLRTLEDALVIYRLARAPERRVWYIDVGNLPKMKAEQYIREIMVKHKNRLIYDATTGEIRDDRKFMCLDMTTKIPLLDGRTLTLFEIQKEYESGKKNWVYSCDPITGKFVPGPISWAGITKKKAQVVKVTLDNGKTIICTPDHKFPVWGKGMIEAQHLIGESIIPGYRKQKELYSNKLYEQIYKNDTKTWEFTHREVAEWKDNNNIREEMIHNEKYANSIKNTIHHKDFNKYNNSPDNLVRMNRNDHMNYHWDCAKYGFGNKINKSEDFTLEWRAKLSIAAKNRIPKCKTWKIKIPTSEEIILENLSEFCRNNNLNRTNIKGKFGSKKYFAEQLINHKAISVEWLEETMDVGCLTIDLDETYHSNHTYLLDAGVYTKNTMLEDYWLPRKEGGRGTEVTTLPAGETLGQLDDVLYFQKKFLQCLNVPVSRLSSDALFSIGRATEITRDELKFARFVVRLRSRFSELFTKMLEKQLILKQIVTPEDWELLAQQIKYNYARDNYFTELKDAEIAEARVNLARNFQDMAGKYYDHRWIRKNVLRQSDEDIEERDENIMMEMESNEPRWFNPMIEQNNQLMQQPQQLVDDGTSDAQPNPQDMHSDTTHQGNGPGGDEMRKKLEQLRQAQVTIDQMKRKKGNRSMTDESKYKAAVQIVAKNKDLLSAIGVSDSKNRKQWSRQ